MTRIVSNTMNQKGSLNIKRCYLPGIIVEDDCPKCGIKWTFNGTNDYVSNPVIGDNIDLHAYCKDCNNEWSVQIQLQVTITL